MNTRCLQVVEKLVLSVRVPQNLLGKIDKEAEANGENRASVVIRHLSAAYGLGESQQVAPSVAEKLEQQINHLTTRIEALEKISIGAIATDAEKSGDIPENSPLRMSQNERNEPIRTNPPEAKGEAATGAETRISPEDLEKLRNGVNQRELNAIRGKAPNNKSLAKWREKEILTAELQKELGLSIGHKGEGKELKYYLLEEN